MTLAHQASAEYLGQRATLLLGALFIGLNALGFTNRSLRAQVSQLLGDDYTTN